MQINKKISLVIFLIFFMLMFSLVSCEASESDKNKISQLESELESKNNRIVELERELSQVKEQLESVQEELQSKDEETTETTQENPEPEKFKVGDIIISSDAVSGESICSLVIHSIENITEYDEHSAPFFRYEICNNRC